MTTVSILNDTDEKVRGLFNTLGRDRPDVSKVANEYRRRFHQVGGIFADENQHRGLKFAMNIPPTTELGWSTLIEFNELLHWLMPKLNALVS